MPNTELIKCLKPIQKVRSTIQQNKFSLSEATELSICIQRNYANYNVLPNSFSTFKCQQLGKLACIKLIIVGELSVLSKFSL